MDHSHIFLIKRHLSKWVCLALEYATARARGHSWWGVETLPFAFVPFGGPSLRGGDTEPMRFVLAASGIHQTDRSN